MPSGFSLATLWLKMGNKGFEAALAAVEMAALKEAISRQSSAISEQQIPRSARNENTARGPRPTASRRDDKSKIKPAKNKRTTQRAKKKRT
jgi:hypothetical protein